MLQEHFLVAKPAASESCHAARIPSSEVEPGGEETETRRESPAQPSTRRLDADPNAVAAGLSDLTREDGLTQHDRMSADLSFAFCPVRTNESLANLTYRVESVVSPAFCRRRLQTRHDRRVLFLGFFGQMTAQRSKEHCAVTFGAASFTDR